jgi:DnaJ-class molecular chaperone
VSDFAGNYKRYDPDKEGYGNAKEWKGRFYKRMSKDEASNILNEDDPYAILGINERATKSEIKKAFRTLAFKWHPDRNPDKIELATEMMKKINAAYAILYYWK